MVLSERSDSPTMGTNTTMNSMELMVVRLAHPMSIRFETIHRQPNATTLNLPWGVWNLHASRRSLRLLPAQRWRRASCRAVSTRL